MDVLVTFVRGRSHREIFYRARSQPLRTREVQSLLRVNSAGDVWHPYETDRQWMLGRADRALAQYDADDNSVVFYTSEYMKRPSLVPSVEGKNR